MFRRDWLHPGRLYDPNVPAGRLEYLWGAWIYPFSFISIIIALWATVIPALHSESLRGGGAFIVVGVLPIIGLLANILMSIRRLKDLNRSGWYLLLLPIFAPAIYLLLLTVPSMMKPSKQPDEEFAQLNIGVRETGGKLDPTGDSIRFCTQCGTPVRPGANFCTGCGTALAGGSHTAHQTEESSSEAIMIEEKDAGQTSIWSKFMWEGGRTEYYASLLILLATLIFAVVAFSQSQWLFCGLSGLIFMATLIYRFFKQLQWLGKR